VSSNCAPRCQVATDQGRRSNSISEIETEILKPLKGYNCIILSCLYFVILLLIFLCCYGVINIGLYVWLASCYSYNLPDGYTSSIRHTGPRNHKHRCFTRHVRTPQSKNKQSPGSTAEFNCPHKVKCVVC